MFLPLSCYSTSWSFLFSLDSGVKGMTIAAYIFFGRVFFLGLAGRTILRLGVMNFFSPSSLAEGFLNQVAFPVSLAALLLVEVVLAVEVVEVKIP